MAESPQLVIRLLNTPGIARVVPTLPAEVLHRVIESCGLEAAAEIVALATPAQIRGLMDIDLWRAPAPGRTEALDAVRFAAWLEALMQSGPEAAAALLAGMDLDLVVGALSDHVAVFDAAAVATYTNLAGEEVAGRASACGQVCELAGLVIEGRPSPSWDVIVELLCYLQDQRPALFGRVMRGCIALSNSAREADGFHELLDDRDQHRLDLSVEREARRDRQGYVAPPQARAFLQGARALRLDGDRPPRDAIAHAVLRDLAGEPPAAHSAMPALLPSAIGGESAADLDSRSAVVEILSEAGVITPPRARLPAGETGDARLAFVHAFAESHLAAAEELGFLANAVVAGCGVSGRALTPPEASDLVLATCNLGLENWPPAWPERDLVTAFQIGWALLDRDVCRHAAAVLIDVLADLECSDREVQWSLQSLRHALGRHLRDGEPWRARPALEALLMLDTASWAVLQALIDECPAMHAVLTAPGALHRIDPAAVTFIARNREIATLREWLSSLPAYLAG